MDLLYKNQIEFLDQCIKNKTFSHAYLFYGNSNLKETAIDFIKKINCQHIDKEPCDKCPACLDIKNGIMQDLKIIEPLPEDNKGNQKRGNEIYIDQIRDAQRFVSLTSANNSHKAVIIESAHYLNQEAQNALLKNLEEPNKNVIFILITPYPDILLPTILSRCTKIFFPFIIQELDNDQKQYIKDICDLINKNMADRFSYAKALFPGKDKAQELNDVKKALSVWLMFFRSAMLYNAGAKNQIDLKIFPVKDVKYTQRKILNIIKKIQMVLGSIDFTNVSQKLSIEIILLEL